MSPAVYLALGVAVLFALFYAMRSKPDSEALAGFVDRKALVVDVRTPGEFRRLHAKRARNIPVDELEDRIGELGEPGPIIVYCASGMRSRRARGVLEQAGFEVLDMGGINNWPKDDLEKRPNDAPI